MDPSYFTVPGIINATDQHPSHDVLDGERLMKTVYEALRASPLWNETVLLITYDEHGGFADFSVPPIQGVPNPDGIPCRDCGIPFNFDRLGVRIPYLAISPWIAKGTVIHAPPANVKPASSSQMELSSIPATIHKFFNTKSFLNARDAWAVPLHWMWENSTVTSPRTDCPMTLPPVPAQSPSFKGKQMGANGLSHLHRDLLYMVQGAFAGIRSKDSSDAHMLAEGLTTEASAGTWIRDTVAKHVGKPSSMNTDI
jgi:phospholipase C